MPDERQDIEFLTADGLKLRGWLYPGGTKKPAIIMTAGFTDGKEPFCSDFALRFQEAGYTAILYDNRNWYSSEGTPRNETDPIMQSRDYTAAINFAMSHPAVHPKKIALWGGSLSGGNAIVAAALDKRAKALISMVPFVSGEYLTMALGPMVNFILADNVAITKGATSQMFPVIPDTVEEMFGSTTGLYPYLEVRDSRGIVWERTATTQSMFHLQLHDPRAYIHRVAPTPLLMILAEKDVVLPLEGQLDMFEKAGKQKQLHMAKGRGHFDVYHGEGFEEVLKVQLEFLKSTFG